MSDREKVIKAIEICYTLGHNCTECPLFPVDDCNDKLMHDALSLLKAQEPRLLKLEEIPEYDGAFLIEYRHEVWPMQWALFRLNLTTVYRFIRGNSELGFSINKDFYGKTWRCWTSRPTEEQRKATPWA
jgi:hypothetical protein